MHILPSNRTVLGPKDRTKSRLDKTLRGIDFNLFRVTLCYSLDLVTERDGQSQVAEAGGSDKYTFDTTSVLSLEADPARPRALIPAVDHAPTADAACLPAGSRASVPVLEQLRAARVARPLELLPFLCTEFPYSSSAVGSGVRMTPSCSTTHLQMVTFLYTRLVIDPLFNRLSLGLRILGELRERSGWADLKMERGGHGPWERAKERSRENTEENTDLYRLGEDELVLSNL